MYSYTKHALYHRVNVIRTAATVYPLKYVSLPHELKRTTKHGYYCSSAYDYHIAGPTKRRNKSL